MTILPDSLPAMVEPAPRNGQILPGSLQGLPAEELLDLLDKAAEEDSREARPANTRAAYAEDWKLWSRYCGQLNVDPLTARDGLFYTFVKWLEGQEYAPSTIERRLAGVAVTLRDRGFALPAKGGPLGKARTEISDYATRLEKANIALGTGKAPGLRPAQVRTICERIRPDLHGLRMKALVLLAVSLAARRSEMANLLVTDIVEDSQGRGLKITLRAAKGGKSRTVAVRLGQDPLTCPVSAWRAWRHTAGLVDGPAFCQIRGTKRVVAVPGAGITPQLAGHLVRDAGRLAGLPLELSGHSARRGYITVALEAGHDVAEVCAVSGHSLKSGTVYEYREEADAWANTTAAAFGL